MRKLVTVAQGMEARNIANQCGISREKFQSLMDSGKFKRFFMGCNDSELLEFVSVVSVDGADNFISSDHFKIGEMEGVKIGFLGRNFKANFPGKVEEDVSEADLKILRLKQDSRDAGIITQLGGEDTAETTLAHLWNLLKKQGHGQNGSLLTNGKCNIFYIRDVSGVLLAVSAHWDYAYHGWCVGADTFEDPRPWHTGYQVISR